MNFIKIGGQTLAECKSCSAQLGAEKIETLSDFRKWSRDNHPDKGGDGGKFAETVNCVDVIIKNDVCKQLMAKGDVSPDVPQPNPATRPGLKLSIIVAVVIVILLIVVVVPVISYFATTSTESFCPIVFGMTPPVETL